MNIFCVFVGFSCPETQKYANMMPKLTDLAYPRCFWPKVIDMVSRFQSRSWSCSELVRVLHKSLIQWLQCLLMPWLSSSDATS